MLTRRFPFLDPVYIAPDLARRLRILADDCERLALGRPVSAILLQNAPLLEDWVPVVTPLGVQLVGRSPAIPSTTIAPSPPPPSGSPTPTAPGLALCLASICWVHPFSAMTTFAPRGTDHDARSRREAETDGTEQGVAITTTGTIAGDNAAPRAEPHCKAGYNRAPSPQDR